MRSLRHWSMTEQAITEFHSSFKDASTLSGRSMGGLTPVTETPTARQHGLCSISQRRPLSCELLQFTLVAQV